MRTKRERVLLRVASMVAFLAVLVTVIAGTDDVLTAYLIGAAHRHGAEARCSAGCEVAQEGRTRVARLKECQ
jgi:Kef-type K+ transport system membrane component KefB